jgi:TRAP-type C4-dicarboxylate transport system permease small subunit
VEPADFPLLFFILIILLRKRKREEKMPKNSGSIFMGLREWIFHDDYARLRRTGQGLLDIIEIYIPTLTFVTLFVVMMLQVFFRYFLAPLTWPLELSLFCYIWTILFSVGYGMRDDSHITFDILYDKASSRGKLFMRIAGNTLVVISFVAAFYPSYKYISFMGFKHSDALQLPMNWVYFPYMVFMVVVIGRLSVQIYKDIQTLIKGEDS